MWSKNKDFLILKNFFPNKDTFVFFSPLRNLVANSCSSFKPNDTEYNTERVWFQFSFSVSQSNPVPCCPTVCNSFIITIYTCCFCPSSTLHILFLWNLTWTCPWPRSCIELIWPLGGSTSLNPADRQTVLTYYHLTTIKLLLQLIPCNNIIWSSAGKQTNLSSVLTGLLALVWSPWTSDQRVFANATGRVSEA